MSGFQHDRGPENRRSRRRFPIEVELYYLHRNGRTIEAAGHGRTVDISSSGILFQATHSVRPGVEMELSLAWPARIDGIVPMQLRVYGQTVREQDNRTAVHIMHYEFRTGCIREPNGRAAASAISA